MSIGMLRWLPCSLSCCGPRPGRSAVDEGAGGAELGACESGDAAAGLDTACEGERVVLRVDARLDAGTPVVLVDPRPGLLVVVVVDVDVTEPDAWSALADVDVVVVVEGHAVLATVLGATVGRADQVGSVRDVDQALVDLVLAAVHGRERVNGVGAVVERVVVDPHAV